MCARLSCTRVILILGGLTGIVLLFTGIFTVPSPPSHTIMPGEPYDKYASSDRDLVINSLGFRLIMGGAATIIVSAILHYRFVIRAEELEAMRIAPAAHMPSRTAAKPIWNSAVLVAAKPTAVPESVAININKNIEPTLASSTISMAAPSAVSPPLVQTVATDPVLPTFTTSRGPNITTYQLRAYPKTQLP